MPGLGEWLVLAVLALFALSGGEWRRALAYLLKAWANLRGAAHRLALEMEKLLNDDK